MNTPRTVARVHGGASNYNPFHGGASKLGAFDPIKLLTHFVEVRRGTRTCKEAHRRPKGCMGGIKWTQSGRGVVECISFKKLRTKFPSKSRKQIVPTTPDDGGHGP